MLRSNFLWRLFTGYAILILVVLAVLGTIWVRQVHRAELEELGDNLHAKTILLKELVLTQRPFDSEEARARFQERLVELGKETRTRLTVLGRDGAVLAESERDPLSMANHLDRPEVQASLSEGVGEAARLSASLNRRFLYHALLVKDGEELVAIVRASWSLERFDARLDELRNGAILTALLAGAVALFLGYWVIRRVMSPLASLQTRVEAILEGSTPTLAETFPDNEFGSLFRALGQLTSQLNERMQQITLDRNKLVTILGGLVEGVIAVDRQERIVHCNDVAARLLRVSPEESEGKFMWEVIRISEITQTLSRTLREQGEVKAEARLPGGPQRTQILEMVGSPLHDGDGNLVGSVVLVNEVTELRRLESIRRDFVANVSHELKTPITAIRGLVETMLTDSDMPLPTRNRFLKKVNKQAIRLSSLVSDLLTLARLESEEEGLQARRVDLREIVENAVRPYRYTDEEPTVKFEVVLPSGAVHVRGDEQSLRMVINNLLDNAIKYTPPGGQVWVRLSTEGASARLEVEDTGIGIEPDHLDRIFERFYRVDKARSRELGGTGLGLSIVKHACLMHGGEVRVESQPGQGSRFWILIPLG